MPNEFNCCLQQAKPHCVFTVRMIVQDQSQTPPVTTYPSPTETYVVLMPMPDNLPDIATVEQNFNVLTVTLEPGAQVGQTQRLNVRATYGFGEDATNVTGALIISVAAPSRGAESREADTGEMETSAEAPGGGAAVVLGMTITNDNPPY